MYLLHDVLEQVPGHPLALEHARDCDSICSLVLALTIPGEGVDSKARAGMAVRQVSSKDIRRQGQADVIAKLEDHLDKLGRQLFKLG